MGEQLQSIFEEEVMENEFEEIVIEVPPWFEWLDDDKKEHIKSLIMDHNHNGEVAEKYKVELAQVYGFTPEQLQELLTYFMMKQGEEFDCAVVTDIEEQLGLESSGAEYEHKSVAQRVIEYQQRINQIIELDYQQKAIQNEVEEGLSQSRPQSPGPLKRVESAVELAVKDQFLGTEPRLTLRSQTEQMLELQNEELRCELDLLRRDHNLLKKEIRARRKVARLNSVHQSSDLQTPRKGADENAGASTDFMFDDEESFTDNVVPFKNDGDEFDLAKTAINLLSENKDSMILNLGLEQSNLEILLAEAFAIHEVLGAYE